MPPIINAVIGLSAASCAIAGSPPALLDPLAQRRTAQQRPDRCVDSVQRVRYPGRIGRFGVCVGVAGGLQRQVNSLWNAAACLTTA